MIGKNDARTTDWIAAILLYLAVLAYQGYQYGQGDQAQILPVLYALDHPDTFRQDHYVQAYLQSEVNERTVFQFFLRYMGYGQPVIVFIWHVCFSLLLIAAWIRITSLFIRNKLFQYISVACILIVGFHTSTGSNELYYNVLIPSLVAKAVASWAIWYWLTEKYYLWAVLLVMATYMQPLVGLQCFLFTGMGFMGVYFLNKKREAIPLRAILTYLACTLPWIYLLGKYNGGQTDPALFMEIMEFRLSHHFFASCFGWLHLAVLSFFLISCSIVYKGKLKWALMSIAFGCLVYEIGVEIFKSPLVLYSQWWKTTIWLEAFGFVALWKWIDEKSGSVLTLKPLSGIVIVLLLVGVYRFSGVFSDKPILDQPLSKSSTDDIEIAKASLRLTPKDALFIIPPEISAFRWYSKRDTYVDYKAMLHQESFLHEWYTRIQKIYHYSLDDKRNGIAINDAAVKALSNPDPQTIASWKSLGITHIIAYPPGNGSLILLAENDTYLLYQLP